MSENEGQCPRCGDTNRFTLAACSGCGSRLPWADALQAAMQRGRQQAAAEIEAARNAANAAQQQAKAADAARKYADLGIYSRGDGPSFVAACIGFFLPIGGLLIYLLQRDSFPERAASAGKGALVGFFVGCVLYAAVWFGLISYNSNFG